MRTYLISILIPTLLLLSSCTEVQVINPNPRVEPPELRGDRGVKVEAAVVPAHVFRATGDGETRPPDLDHPSEFKSLNLAPGVTYSPAPPVEFGLETSALNLGLAAVLKWQPIGEGTRAASEGNVPVGFYLRAGTSYAHSSGDQAYLFGPGGYGWKGTVATNYIHVGTSVGYRLAEHGMIYGGLAFGEYWVRTEVDQDSASDGTGGGAYKTGYTGYGDTTALGGLFNWKHVQFYVSAEYSHLEYKRTSPTDDIYFHGGVYITPH